MSAIREGNAHMIHPNERPGLSRRDFLRRAAIAGIALPSMAAILAACGSGAQDTVATGAAGGSEQRRTSSGPVASPGPRTRSRARTRPSPGRAGGQPGHRRAAWSRRRAPRCRSCAGPTTSTTGVLKAFEKKYNCKITGHRVRRHGQGPREDQLGSGRLRHLFGMNVWAVGRIDRRRT